MPAPPELITLINRFNRNREDYRKGHFKEAQLRIDYLDPLFELLGWDVRNRAGYAEKYRDVIYEDQIKIGGMTKAPDYCFKRRFRQLCGSGRRSWPGIEIKSPAMEHDGGTESVTIAEATGLSLDALNARVHAL